MKTDIQKSILFVSYTNSWVGPTISLYHMLRYLREDYAVSVLLPGEGPVLKKLRNEGICCFTLPSITKRWLPSIVRLILRENIDLVYANHPDRTARLTHAAARLSLARYICHVRAPVSKASWLYLGHLMIADGVIAVSKACASSVQRFVRNDRLHVVYNGVPRTHLDQSRKDIRRSLADELGVPEDALLIVAVGHLCARKGQLYGLQAMSHVLREVPSAQLLLVGHVNREPSYVNQLELSAAQLDVDSNVHMLGFRPDVERILAAGDLFLHTAVADPHPRSVLEAMSAGLPVVGFAVDGVAETVVNGRTGFLVPPGDVPGLVARLIDLLQNAGDRAEFGVAAKKRVEEHFTARQTAEGINRILRSVLGLHYVKGIPGSGTEPENRRVRTLD